MLSEVSVLLDGKPMTREALLAVVVGSLPVDFDVAEGMTPFLGLVLHEWCVRRGVPTELVVSHAVA